MNGQHLEAPRAFTLVEMLLATMLLALLMAGVLAVVADFGNTQKAIAAAPDSAAATDVGALAKVAELLQSDMLEAQSVDNSRDSRITLTGYSALNVGAEEITHRPVRVEYQLEQIGNRTCLVRRQILLDLPTNQNVRRDLVWVGIVRFALSRVTPKEITPAPSVGMPVTTVPGDRAPAAERWNLQIWLSDHDTPLQQRLAMPAGGGR